jgi:Ca2+-binding EF-hand superfamily protein
MLKKQELYELYKDKINVEHKEAVNLDKVELFRTFKKYDRNQNGQLEFSEYTQCLTESNGLDLTK